MTLSFLNPKGVFQPTGYAHVVSAEGAKKFLFISGQVARDEMGNIIGAGDLEGQTRQVYKNLSAILSAMGASFADVVKQNIYTTRPDEMPTIRKVRDQFMPRDPPASTAVGVTALAQKDLLVEIEMIAV